MARYLAVDWDQQQLQVVAASMRGRDVRVEKAISWTEAKSPNPAEADELGRLLRERLREGGIAPAPVVFCVGRDRVILKELRYPAVAPHEEPEMVRLQVLKELTDNPNDVVIDYVSSPAGGKETRAQAVIVRRELLSSYQNIARAAGLKLVGLTPRPFGSALSVAKLLGTTPLMPPPEPADAPVALVTVAERWAEFSVVRGGQPQLIRALNVGPGLAGDIRRNLAVYAGQAPHAPIRAVYLALGEPLRENGHAHPTFEPASLRQRLAEMVELPIHLFDPFAGSDNPDLPTGLRGSFIGAVGVLHGMAGVERLPINFVQPRKPAPPRSDAPRRLALVACLAVALFAAVGAMGWMHLQKVKREADRAEQQNKDLEVQLAKIQQEGKVLKALESWETVVWLDELYDLTHRSPNIDRNFQLSSLEGQALKPVPGSPHVGRLVARGSVQDPTALKKLNDEYLKDLGKTVGAYYRPKPPTIKRNEFEAEVWIKKRPPLEFDRELPPMKREAARREEPKKDEPKKDEVKEEPKKDEPKKDEAKEEPKKEEPKPPDVPPVIIDD